MGLAKAIKRGASALLIGSMMTGLFTGCSATGENSGGKLVKIAVCVSDQTPAAQALADVFKPMVEEATDGRYDIQIYNSGVLGSEKVTYDYTKSGIVEMCVVGTTMWSETPKMSIPDFPFLFDSVEHARVCYQGELGDQIDAYSRKTGGYLRKSDLENYWCEWVKPIHVNYRGYDICEIPPNGDGIIALMALNILKGYSFTDRSCVDTVHKQLEAMKLAFADGNRYVADPEYMRAPVETLLSDEYAAERRSLIGEMAQDPEPGDPFRGGTIYLCTADGEGNMVSYIQSNYMGFGSGIVIPGTGIALQNRGANFTLDEDMENRLGPGKKSLHTIIPGFLMKDGKAVGPFGVMGGFMQPQGHVQVIMNTRDFMMNPQETLDVPRWQWVGGKKIQVEKTFPAEIVEELKRRGHEMEVLESSLTFGRGQIIWRDENGVLCGATEPRADGAVAVW